MKKKDIRTLVVIIWVKTNSKNYAASTAMKTLIFFILIDLKRKINENIVFLMKRNTPLNIPLKQILSKFFRSDEVCITIVIAFELSKCCVQLKSKMIWNV